MDKYALIKKITDTQELTDEEKSALLELLRTKKKYGIVWEDKPENVEERLQNELPVLTEVKERAIISDDEDAPDHIIIEGDNLDALITLVYTHAGKIDVIYIDPPYNRGDKGKNAFRYNDKIVDLEDEYKHSKWLSFMNKRLKIAKQLLSEKGVVFISIDDHEQSQLRLLCDEIFGEKNFLGQLIIETATDNNPSQINTEHEYMMSFAKNKSLQDNWSIKSVAAGKIIQQYEKLKKICSNTEEIQKQLREWIKKNKEHLPQVAHYKDVDEYGVYSSSSNSSNPHPGGYMYEIIHPKTGKPCPKPKNGWRWPSSTFWNYDKEGQIKWGRDETTQPHVKKRIETAVEYLRTIIYEDNRATTNALIDMFNGESVFENPKPTNIIKKILDYSTQKTSTILDFFAGSGTTLHATMQLNAEDGGHRQCILVTNNENNICEEVTYERNRRVIQGYKIPNGEAIAGLTNNNLRYFKTDFVSRDRTPKVMRELMDMATYMLCIKENLYKEELMFGNQKAHNQLFRYFTKDDKKMLVVYCEEVIEELVEEIFNIELSVPIKVYVFSPSEDPWEGMFGDVAGKVELCALPYSIYNAYRRVLPNREDKNIESNIEDTTPQENKEF